MQISELQAIYTAYGEALAQAHRRSSIFSGLFGQGSFDDPRSNPCNREFYEKTGDWIRRFAASHPEQPSVLEVSRFVLDAAVNHQKEPTYWYFLVCQGYVKELLPLLLPDSCAELAAEFDRHYPKRQRLPIQDELYGLLIRRSAE